LDEYAVAEAWGYDTSRSVKKYLEEQARRRILFQNDGDTADKARTVSDAFEHGFEDFGKLRPIACEIMTLTARIMLAVPRIERGTRGL
jgi:hypothetical protein